MIDDRVEAIVLQRLNKLEEKMDLCRIDIAGLKVKSGVWGLVGGMIPPAIGLVMWALSVAV